MEFLNSQEKLLPVLVPDINQDTDIYMSPDPKYRFSLPIILKRTQKQNFKREKLQRQVQSIKHINGRTNQKLQRKLKLFQNANSQHTKRQYRTLTEQKENLREFQQSINKLTEEMKTQHSQLKETNRFLLTQQNTPLVLRTEFTSEFSSPAGSPRQPLIGMLKNLQTEVKNLKTRILFQQNLLKENQKESQMRIEVEQKEVKKPLNYCGCVIF